MSIRRKSCVTDWFRIICDLGNCGLSLQGISDTLKIPKPTINNWKIGSEPKHSDGERLINLWRNKTGREKTDLPKVSIKSCYHL